MNNRAFGALLAGEASFFEQYSNNEESIEEFALNEGHWRITANLFDFARLQSDFLLAGQGCQKRRWPLQVAAFENDLQMKNQRIINLLESNGWASRYGFQEKNYGRPHFLKKPTWNQLSAVACQRLDLKLLHKSLDAGADPNSQGVHGESLLQSVARQSDYRRADVLSLVQLLLDRGADVNLRDKNGGTALIKAVLGRFSALVRFLLEKGADPLVCFYEEPQAQPPAIDYPLFDHDLMMLDFLEAYKTPLRWPPAAWFESTSVLTEFRTILNHLYDFGARTVSHHGV